MDPKKVRSAPFYQGCMEIGKATENLNMDNLEDEEEDTFDSMMEEETKTLQNASCT